MNYDGLYPHGIQNEDSDFRAHISFGVAYIFSTQSGRDAIAKLDSSSVRCAHTGNYISSRGFIVPVRQISNIRQYIIPGDIMWSWSDTLVNSTSTKGKKAVSIFCEMLKRGLINISFSLNEVTDKDIQISGIDIFVSAKYKFQVKADLKAIVTGNVYLETHELNYYKQY